MTKVDQLPLNLLLLYHVILSSPSTSLLQLNAHYFIQQKQTRGTLLLLLWGSLHMWFPSAQKDKDGGVPLAKPLISIPTPSHWPWLFSENPVLLTSLEMLHAVHPSNNDWLLLREPALIATQTVRLQTILFKQIIFSD